MQNGLREQIMPLNHAQDLHAPLVHAGFSEWLALRLCRSAGFAMSLVARACSGLGDAAVLAMFAGDQTVQFKAQQQRRQLSHRQASA